MSSRNRRQVRLRRLKRGEISRCQRLTRWRACWPTVTRFAPLREQIGQAEAALAAHDARRAIEIAQGTAAGVAALAKSIQSYTELQARIAQGRAEAAVLEQQGYHAAGSRAALDQAQLALDAAVAALERDGVAATEAPLGDCRGADTGRARPRSRPRWLPASPASGWSRALRSPRR